MSVRQEQLTFVLMLLLWETGRWGGGVRHRYSSPFPLYPKTERDEKVLCNTCRDEVITSYKNQDRKYKKFIFLFMTLHSFLFQL